MTDDPQERYPDGESPVTEEEAKEQVEPPNDPDQEPGTDDLPIEESGDA